MSSIPAARLHHQHTVAAECHSIPTTGLTAALQSWMVAHAMNNSQFFEAGSGLQVPTSWHLVIVLKWLQCGSLFYGSDDNSGPCVNFPHLENSKYLSS